MADPLEILKQIALQRAMQNQQPQLASASMGDNGVPQLPQGQAPQVQMQQPNVGAQSPQVQPVQTQPGPIKSFLSQFIYGAGQGLVKHAGLETDAERQQRQLQDQLQQQAGQRAQQTANDMSAYRNAQVGGLQAKADQLDAANQPFTIPNDPSIPSALRGTQTTVGAWNNTLKPLIVNLGKTDTATIGANAKTTAAQTQADASMQNAETAANVKRDIGTGNLRMAGARLALAQQVAAAKQNGTFGAPPADRLRRGDLANNAQDNINGVIEDIKANPDLVGQIAGHFTTAQQMIGSDNPAIARIGIRIHNAALASNGAHGLRSAQAVPETENVMLNHFRNGPEATLSGLGAMNQSLDTFIQDAANGKVFVPGGGSANKTPSTGGVPEYVRGPDGRLVRK